MAKLYISEYADQGMSGNSSTWGAFRIDVAQEPAAVDQVVTFTGGETKSAAFGATTKYIRVHTDSICSILIGSNPTATTNSKRIAANSTEYFGVAPGHKLSVIANS